MAHLWLAAAALGIEATAGYPDRLFRLIGHPVTWMGAWLSGLERNLNRPEWLFRSRKIAGIIALAALLGATMAATVPIAWIWPASVQIGVAVLLSASLPAQRSLFLHVRAVADGLDRDGLEGGRRAVSMIVGRNPAYLDQAGVSRAAIESLAENFSDGVVAPALWTAIGGLPGGALYKAVNTADSMIGHKSERYRAFGWAAARLDDLINLPASRLSALWIVLAAAHLGADWRGALVAIRRDARHHRSPNAGWPEAAMAGALGVRLAGPRVYGETRVEDGYMGFGRDDLSSADIRAALKLYGAACMVQGAVLVTVSLALTLFRF